MDRRVLCVYYDDGMDEGGAGLERVGAREGRNGCPGGMVAMGGMATAESGTFDRVAAPGGSSVQPSVQPDAAGPTRLRTGGAAPAEPELEPELEPEQPPRPRPRRLGSLGLSSGAVQPGGLGHGHGQRGQTSHEEGLQGLQHVGHRMEQM